ncbi:hypothetical protein [Pontibacillus marinus]|uniref:Uncharacterized protein n=1 Tax=Pontibacillus marinus BH030004 = DSM 16465 TaxID=1385511 RepID=A0A0A5HPS3_9BACI|nr:hypothetical protein [Pontibacillus marinus]KGX85627.1 hypothetical protein N783_14125 [Pontibacillus marinus BH030004 = DSM 16465]
MNWVLILCTGLLIVSFIISCSYAIHSVKKKGEGFMRYGSEGAAINFLSGILAGIIWFFYAGPINVFMLFGGMVYILACTAVCILILWVVLFVYKQSGLTQKQSYMQD